MWVDRYEMKCNRTNAFFLLLRLSFVPSLISSVNPFWNTCWHAAAAAAAAHVLPSHVAAAAAAAVRLAQTICRVFVCTTRNAPPSRLVHIYKSHYSSGTRACLQEPAVAASARALQHKTRTTNTNTTARNAAPPHSTAAQSSLLYSMLASARQAARISTITYRVSACH